MIFRKKITGKHDGVYFLVKEGTMEGGFPWSSQKVSEHLLL